MKKLRSMFALIAGLLVALVFAACVGTQVKAESAPVEAQANPAPVAEAIEVKPKYDPNTAKPDDLLPLAPELTKGVFENGLTYYIRKNGNPGKRAVMYLVVKAGSVHETDSERGYAHFIEHMAFNGTLTFPENQLVDYFRSIGMEFGAEVNAYTTYDNTVYMIEMPLDKLTYFQKGLQILKEFAQNVTFDPVEVEKEKGVILEELRLDKGSKERALSKEMSVMLGSTPYADREPIGTEASIKTATAESLKAFYGKHYTLNRMALIVVADLSQTYVSRTLKEMFEKLPANPQALTNYVNKIAPLDSLRYSVSTDNDFGIATLSYQQLAQLTPEKTIKDYSGFVLRNLVEQAVNYRLNAIVNSGKAPWEAAYFGSDYFFGQTRTLQLIMRAKAGKEKEAFGVFMQELERLRQHGFTASEFSRAVASHRAWVKTLDVEDMDLQSGSFADEYVRNFMYDEPVPGVTNERVYITNILNNLKLEELNEYLRGMLKDFSKGFVSVRTKPQFGNLVAEDFARLVGDAKSKAYEPFVSQDKTVGLYDNLLPPGTIAKEETLDNGVTKLLLSNGATVYLKPTQFDKDTVKVFGFARGGFYALGEQDVQTSRLLSYFMSSAGYGDLSVDRLDELLAPYRVNLNWSIDATSQYLIADTKTNDIEPLLRAISLLQISPGKDIANFNRTKESLISQLEELATDPDFRFSNDWQKSVYGDSVYVKDFSIPEVEAVTYDASAALMRRLFGNAADFTYVIVGDFSLDAMKALLAKHIASIPGAQKTNAVWKAVSPLKSSKDKVVFDYAKEDKADVVMYFTGALPYTWQNDQVFEITKASLNNRLLDRIREELSGTYGVSCEGSISAVPTEEYRFIVRFSTDPARVDELIDAVQKEIDAFVGGTFDTKYITQIQAQLKRGTGYVNTNDFWLWNIGLTLLNGSTDFSFAKLWATRPDLATKENIQSMAQMIFAPENRYIFVLMPKAK